MFTGTHDDSDAWLEKNKGVRFHLKNIDGKDVVETTRVSENIDDPALRLRNIPDFSNGFLWENLSERHFSVLCEGLSSQLVDKLKMLTSISSEDELMEIACSAEGRVDLVYDTFDLLRGGFVKEAKGRIDLFKNDVQPIETIENEQVENISSGEEVVMNDDIDPYLFEHFLKTSTFQKWMVYLHPGQREFVTRNFNGPARLSGVSGSGKTSVLKDLQMNPRSILVLDFRGRHIERFVSETLRSFSQ